MKHLYPHMIDYGETLDKKYGQGVMPDKLDYKKMYHMDDMQNSGMRKAWDARKLRVGDNYPAIAFAYGIIDYSRDETIDVKKQMDLVIESKTRTPYKVLEVGGGNGSVSLTLSNYGCDVTCIEPMTSVKKYWEMTNEHWFGSKKHNVRLINKPLHKSLRDINIRDFDTIILSEVLEHILPQDFQKFEKLLHDEFSGRCIYVNDTHPCGIGSGIIYQEHCRLVDDFTYDGLSVGWDVIHREKGHLVLEKIIEDVRD